MSESDPRAALALLCEFLEEALATVFRQVTLTRFEQQLHHVRGNERGKARVDRVKKLLDEIGLGRERLEMFFVSGSMGATFARHAEEMTERIRALEPNPLRLRNK